MHSPIFNGTYGITNLNKKEQKKLLTDKDELLAQILEADYILMPPLATEWEFEQSGKIEKTDNRIIWTITRKAVEDFQKDCIEKVQKYLNTLRKIQAHGEFGFGKFPLLTTNKYTKEELNSLFDFRNIINQYGGQKIVIDGYVNRIIDLMEEAGDFYMNDKNNGKEFAITIYTDLTQDYHF